MSASERLVVVTATATITTVANLQEQLNRDLTEIRSIQWHQYFSSGLFNLVKSSEDVLFCFSFFGTFFEPCEISSAISHFFCRCYCIFPAFRSFLSMVLAQDATLQFISSKIDWNQSIIAVVRGYPFSSYLFTQLKCFAFKKSSLGSNCFNISL